MKAGQDRHVGVACGSLRSLLWRRDGRAVSVAYLEAGKGRVIDNGVVYAAFAFVGGGGGLPGEVEAVAGEVGEFEAERVVDRSVVKWVRATRAVEASAGEALAAAVRKLAAKNAESVEKMSR